MLLEFLKFYEMYVRYIVPILAKFTHIRKMLNINFRASGSVGYTAQKTGALSILISMAPLELPEKNLATSGCVHS